MEPVALRARPENRRYEMRGPHRLLGLAVASCIVSCGSPAGDYTPVSSISTHGFARNGEQMRRLAGQEIRLWGFVDHHNLFGDDDVRDILGDWWGGAGPDPATWSFHLKARAGDAAGQSFAVFVPNDEGRDEVLRTFRADAMAGRPTKVFVTGTLFTFDAPTNTRSLTGLYMRLGSSHDVLFDLPRT